MNLIKTNWFCSLMVFITGGVLCFLSNRPDVLKIIVYILGAVFTLTGCLNIIGAATRHSSGESHAVASTVAWLAGIGGIGLGAAMLIVPRQFTPILIYLFAALLVVGGLWHFIVLGGYYKQTGLPGWLYFLPLIMLVAGVVLFCAPSVHQNIKLCIIITGIGGLLYGLTTLLEYIYASAHARKLRKQAAETAPQTETSPAAVEAPTAETQADNN